MNKKFVAWVAMLLLSLAALWPYLGQPLPVQTNVLAMLPDDARQPAVEQALAQLAARAGERLVLVVGHPDADTANRLAAGVETQLRQSPLLKSVQGRVQDWDVEQLILPYARYRPVLLSPDDRQGLQRQPAEHLQYLLQRRLGLPGAGGFGLAWADDPFGLFDQVVSHLPHAMGSLQWQQGWLTASRAGWHWRLLSAPLQGDAYDPALQQDLTRLVDGLRQQAEAQDGQLLATGAVLFAAEARQQAETEMNLIGTVSLVAVVVLMLGVFRRVRHLLLSGMVIAAGTLVAVAATLLVYGQLHLLTLVMGASLIGVAIDYSTHLFASQLQDGDHWDVQRALEAIHPAIRMGLLTTLLGYGALALLTFPGLRQIAFFSSAGLIGSYLTVLWGLPVFVRQPSARSARPLLVPVGRVFDAYSHWLRGRRLIGLLLLLAVCTLPGWTRLQTDDDIRQLIKPSDDLLRQEQQIRDLTGQGNSRQFFLLEADSEAALLALGQRLNQQLDSLVDRGELQGYQSLASWVPPPGQQRHDHALLQQAVQTEGQALLRDAGVRDGIVTHYVTQLNQPPAWLDVDAFLALPLSTPVRHLWFGAEAGVWRMAVVPGAFRSLSHLHEVAQGLPGVTLVDKASAVSDSFRQFRESASVMFALSLLAVVVLMSRRYGWRRALLLAAPVALSVLFTLGVLGWLGVRVNLFVALGFLMVLGVGVDYAIFVEEGRHHQRYAAVLAVGLSALTTLLSFGLLAMSATPAVRGFGLTQLIGVGFSVLLAPMVLAWGHGPKEQAP